MVPHVDIIAHTDALLIIGGEESSIWGGGGGGGGGGWSKVVQSACVKNLGHAHLIEVQRSIVALECTCTTVAWSKEMMENVHKDHFLRLFQTAFDCFLVDLS